MNKNSQLETELNDLKKEMVRLLFKRCLQMSTTSFFNLYFKSLLGTIEDHKQSTARKRQQIGNPVEQSEGGISKSQ